MMHARYKIYAVVATMLALMSMSLSMVARAKTELVLSQWGSIDRWEPLFERFEAEHPDIEMSYFSTAHSGYYDRIFAMQAGGVAPDIIVSNPQNAPYFIDQGVWLRLDELMERDGFTFDDYIEAGWAYGRHKGSYYAWPSGINPAFPAQVYVYNRDMFQQAGMSDLTPDWAFEDYVELSKQLTKDTNGDGQPEVYGTMVPVLKWYWDWVWSNGGKILNDDFTEFRLTEPASIEALELVVDLWRNTFGVIATEGNRRAIFGNGAAAIVNMPLPEVLQMGEVDNLGFDWALMSTPNGKAGSIARGGDLPMGINSASAHIEEAWTFFKWIVREDVQQWIVDEGLRFFPVHRGALSQDFVRLDGPPHDLTPLVQQQVGFQPMCMCWVEVDETIIAALRKAIDENLSVRNAIEEIAGPIAAILAKYQK